MGSYVKKNKIKNKKANEREKRREGRKERREEKGRKVGYHKSHALGCLTEELSRNILAAQTASWLLLTTYS